MTAHWIFIIPIALAFLLRKLNGLPLLAARLLVAFLVIYLYAYNLYLLVGYFVG